MMKNGKTNCLPSDSRFARIVSSSNGGGELPELTFLHYQHCLVPPRLPSSDEEGTIPNLFGIRGGRAIPEAGGHFPEASGERAEASGIPAEASGILAEPSAVAPEASAAPPEASGEPAEPSGMLAEASGIMAEASANTLLKRV